MSDPPRRYDGNEIDKLLKRATELQRDESSGSLPSGGLSLVELEEIALEAGIDPLHLRHAARELDTAVETGGVGPALAGAPVMLVLERTIAGEISDGAFERLLLEIQRNTNRHGQPSLLGRTLTWRDETPSNTRSTQVLVASRDGETHIRIEERLHQLAGGLFGGIVTGGGIGVGVGVGLPIGLKVLGSALFATAFPFGVLGMSYILAREIFTRMSRSRQKALQDLLARLCEVVEQEVREALPSGEEA